MNCGSWPRRRQPSLPRSSADCAFEYASASWPKSSPAAARPLDVLCQRLDLGHLLGRRRLGQREQDVGDVVLRVDAGLARVALERLLELARRDVDAREHVALAQHRQHDLAAHLLAVGRVVDALLLQHARHLLELDVVALGDVAQRLVQHLVRHLDAEAPGTLDLDFLEDQALEHLLTDDVGGRQLRALALQAVGDEGGLRLELALQDHALVDDRDHAVERDAARGHVPGLRERQSRPAGTCTAIRSGLGS